MEQEPVTEEVLEQNVRDRVRTAARQIYENDPDWQTWPRLEWEHLGLFAQYCILRSVERQEKLMQRMEKQQKVMTRLTVAVVVLTAAVVVLTVFVAFRPCG